MYFSKKSYELVGIEVPINYDLPNKIKFVGYIDVLIYDTVRDKYKIIDIKTSTMGWNKWAKADKTKTDQLLLYKQFYGAQHDIPLDKIDIEYFIVKAICICDIYDLIYGCILFFLNSNSHLFHDIT